MSDLLSGRELEHLGMDSLVAVEKEVDRAVDLFDTFYDGIDQDINKVIDYVVSIMNDLVKSILLLLFKKKKV